MGYCDDCGCRTSDGVCSNCQEELYIVENQGEFIEGPLSDEFMERVREQRAVIRRPSKHLIAGVTDDEPRPTD
jgi:hypothetical protein